MEEHERIELRSEDVQEIIGTPPRWIVRWGTFIVSAAVIAMVAMSFFVKYPDKVVGEVTVTSKVAAVRVNSQQSGRVSEMFVEDGDTVVKNQLLIVMQDAANWEDVEELEELIRRLKDYDNQELIDFFPSEFLPWEIGRLQPSYSQLQRDLKTFQFNEQNQAAAREIQDKKDEIAKIKRGVQILVKSKSNADEQKKIAYNQWQRARTGYKQDVVAFEVVENKKNIYLRAVENVRTIEKQINDRSIEQSRLAGQITRIQNQSSLTGNENKVQLEKSINILLAEIDKWNEDHLITAAIDGKVSMHNNWSQNQNFRQGEEILAILPNDIQNNLFIQCLIGIDGSGKVDTGQTVLLKFYNYPYREYGQVDGKVVELPGLPIQDPNNPNVSLLPVKIKLNQGLVTRSGKELKFEQIMRGAGEIITEDRSVFIRIFENIAEPFMNSSSPASE